MKYKKKMVSYRRETIISDIEWRNFWENILEKNNVNKLEYKNLTNKDFLEYISNKYNE